jgi:hypothetical protein
MPMFAGFIWAKVFRCDVRELTIHLLPHRHSREGGNPSPARSEMRNDCCEMLPAQVLDSRLRGSDEAV